MNTAVMDDVPPRLVYLWSRMPGDRTLQVVFEWEASWPEKYVIECVQGRTIVARSPHMGWDAARLLLNVEFTAASGKMLDWYQLVLARLQGGSIDS